MPLINSSSVRVPSEFTSICVKMSLQQNDQYNIWTLHLLVKNIWLTLHVCLGFRYRYDDFEHEHENMHTRHFQKIRLELFNAVSSSWHILSMSSKPNDCTNLARAIGSPEGLWPIPSSILYSDWKRKLRRSSNTDADADADAEVSVGQWSWWFQFPQVCY